MPGKNKEESLSNKMYVLDIHVD